MRKFDVVFFYPKKNKNLGYKDLEGKKAIRLMERLEKQGFNPVSITKSFGNTEYLSLAMMKESVI